jgi:heterodisulfide reductase subunit C
MHNNNNVMQDVERMTGVNLRKCMKCGKCSATCPAYDEMEYHSHQFVYMVEKGDVEKLANSASVYKCLSCMACVERCPRGVAPAAVVEAVRDTVVRMQGKNGIKAEEIPPIVDEFIPQQLLVSAYRKYNK